MKRDLSDHQMYIVCCAQGKGVVVGYVRGEPKVGEPCRIVDGRMVLRWEGSHGLFWVATKGFDSGSRVTARVPLGETSPVTEWLRVEPEAEEKINAWPDC